MPTFNAENERIKRRYFTYLKESQRFSEASIDPVAKALARFEAYTRYRPFKSFHISQAISFKRKLANQLNERTNERLSKATVYSTLIALKRFFHWLAGQPGFRSKFAYSDSEYFNPSGADTAVAKARRQGPVPSLEQIGHLLRSLPAKTEIEMRNRAVIAFTILTGARDGAIASMKLKHVDLTQGQVRQDAREVRTKFSKTFTTTFFPIGCLPLGIVTDWIDFLQKEKLWGPDDPLFPATRVAVGASKQFEAVGLYRKHWSSASPIREIFGIGCKIAGLPYFNPHSFRNTLVTLGESSCHTPEEFKAWSQNLGHERVMTTFSSYGNVSPGRQAEIIRGLERPSGHEVEIEQLARRLANLAKRA